MLAFNRTYETNAYRKLLVILVDINHHHQTILFGCALLVNEIVSSYTRVLETFLDVMNNKMFFPFLGASTNIHIKNFVNYFFRYMFIENTVGESSQLKL